MNKAVTISSVLLFSIFLLFLASFAHLPAAAACAQCPSGQYSWPDCTCHENDVYNMCVNSGVPLACCGEPGQDNSQARESQACLDALGATDWPTRDYGTYNPNAYATFDKNQLYKDALACFSQGSTDCSALGDTVLSSASMQEAKSAWSGACDIARQTNSGDPGQYCTAWAGVQQSVADVISDAKHDYDAWKSNQGNQADVQESYTAPPANSAGAYKTQNGKRSFKYQISADYYDAIWNGLKSNAYSLDDIWNNEIPGGLRDDWTKKQNALEDGCLSHCAPNHDGMWEMDEECRSTCLDTQDEIGGEWDNTARDDAAADWQEQKSKSTQAAQGQENVQDKQADAGTAKPAPATQKNNANTQASQQQSQAKNIIPDQELNKMQDKLNLAVNTWSAKANQATYNTAHDWQDKPVTDEDLKKGVSKDLPQISVDYSLKSGKKGDTISAELPPGIVAEKITGTLKSDLSDAKIDYTVIYGKQWQQNLGASGPPDYPVPGMKSELDKILVIDTIEKKQKVDVFGQALIEYTMPQDTYAYTVPDSTTTAAQLKSQQDFFKGLEQVSDAKSYLPATAGSSALWSLLETIGQANNNRYANIVGAKGVIFTVYDENTKKFTKVPNWNVGCSFDECHYMALAPHLSTFAIITVTQPVNTAFAIGMLTFLLIALVLETALLVFMYRRIMKRTGEMKENNQGEKTEKKKDKTQDKEVQGKGKGIASLILGILGILLMFAPYLGYLTAGYALIYGNAQKKQLPTKIGKAGFVLGIIGVCLNAAIYLIATVIMLMALY